MIADGVAVIAANLTMCLLFCVAVFVVAAAISITIMSIGIFITFVIIIIIITNSVMTRPVVKSVVSVFELWTL